MATTEPVTLSGFYEERDGGYRYYRWVAGRLFSSSHRFERLGTGRLVLAVEDLGDLSTPENMRELGFSTDEICQAVADGELEWNVQGRLVPIFGTTSAA